MDNLGDISGSKFHNSPIKIRAIISGKSETPYKIPRIVTVECQSEDCTKCKFAKKTDIIIEPIDERFLMFIDISTLRIPTIVKIYAGAKCKSLSIDVKETQNVLRIFVAQPPGEDRTKWSAAQTSYYVGHNIDANHIYFLNGYATVDPKNQSTTFVFTSATKSKSDIESFALTKSTHQRLLEFQPNAKTVEDIYEYLGKLYESYALNVTKIYHRFQLHMAIDLVYHSALEFTLPGDRPQPARIDAIIIGDTRCGKGHVAEGLSRFFSVGEIVGAENCTFAGLVGGAQQIGNHWVITWGRIPLNDRGLVIIDEASELKDEDWTRLSRIRSEGIAEVTKIQQQVTNARTRLLFLSNPPSKAMSNYTFGIHALQELVHAPEDIARFDYAAIVSHEEVDIEKINRMYSTTKFLHDKSLERELIMWIWSRKCEEILITPEAVEEIFRVANRYGKFYDISIPLIQGENIRFKLAKIAIACAGRLYSTSENGKILKVNRVHVQCAATFLRSLYKSDANGYYDHSWQKREFNPKLQKESIDALVGYFNAYPSQNDAFQYLLGTTYINSRDLIEYLNISTTAAVEVISKLIGYKCIVKKGQNYVKTSHFTKWLRDRVRASRRII